MDLELNNRRILITGGASGIGAAVVRSLAAEGGRPVIIDRDRTEADRLREELENRGHQIEIVIADLGSESSCREAVEIVMESDQDLHGLVNNAGVNDGVALESADPGTFPDSLKRNLHHVYFITRATLPALKKSHGSIVNISSKTAVTGQGGTSGYVAAKSAQLGLTREWAVDLLPYGIRVNAVIPAEVLTPQYDRWLQNCPDPDAERKRIEQKIPLGQRLTRPGEIADTVLFLLSARSSHTTGQWIHVDGGYVHLDRALPPSERSTPTS